MTENSVQKFDQAAFFDSVRASIFGGSLQQTQVEGMQILGAECQKAQLYPMIEQTAYVMATAYHETAQTMQPIAEYGGASTRYAPWYGRGFVQLTWEENYKKQQDKMGEMPFETFRGDSWRVHDDADRAMIPDVSAYITVFGMADGDFTGMGLNDYIKPKSVDYVNARRIVNGTDRADMIAGYAKKFEDAIRLGYQGVEMPSPLPTMVSVTADYAQLGIYDEHPHVLRLRGLLGELSPTNELFNSQLDKDVRDFQGMSGLGVDGIVGEMTWKALLA